MEAGPQSTVKTIEPPMLSRSQKKRLKKVKHKKALKEADSKKKPLQKAEAPAFKRIHDDIAHFSTLYKQAEKLVKDKEAEYYQKL